MGKKFFTICLCSLAFASCNKFDLDYNPTVVNKDKEAINENAAAILGTIDPNQTWNSIKSGFVTITADADLDNIAKVQILTESPFMNPDAKVLNEVSATNGQTVTLVYDAPNVYSNLVAACVSKDGAYYIKPFEVDQTEVSFQSSTTRSIGRRAAESTYSFPHASNFVLPLNKSFITFNAIRAIRANEGVTTNNIDRWKNSGWENDRMWRNNSSNQSSNSLYKTTYDGSDWYMQNFSIRRDLTADISEDEANGLATIFNDFLYWSEENTKKNNLDIIRNSDMVKLYHNQLETTGEPVILTPVQITSTDMAVSDVYYYYYNPQDTVGMSQDEVIQYLKDLPKFMAIAPSDLFPHRTNEKGNDEIYGSADFFKKAEYVLPYYGDMPCLQTTTLNYTTKDNKFYRIRNGATIQDESNVDYGKAFYMSCAGTSLDTLYTDDQVKLAYQLWQIFEDGNGNCYLYNVGAHCFLVNDGDWSTKWSATDYVDAQPYTMKTTENGAVQFISQGGKQNGKKLGSDLNPFKNYNVWSDKNTNTGTCDWYLEEYNKGNFAMKEQIQQVDKEITAQSFTIPKGYKIGFGLRKAKYNADDALTNHYKNLSYTNKYNGDVYGDGRLNKEINKFPDHFMGNANKDVMLETDPRMAIFNANGKTYMTFEDGSDANYVDMIVEVTNGVELVNDTDEPDTEAYTMCFEDRPVTADYDMNDVVLSCTRKDATTFTLSLVACGANDSIFIHDALGLWEYNGKEVHQIFGLEDNGFVNTVVGGTTMEPVSADITVPESMTIPAYLKNIFIENKSTGKTIKIADQGQAPCAIIIPGAFNYPRERVSIINAYTKFKNWAQDATADTDWYLYEDEEQVYPNPYNE